MGCRQPSESARIMRVLRRLIWKEQRVPIRCSRPRVPWVIGERTEIQRMPQARPNGTLVNGATYGTGISGQAFSFDGVDDYAQIGSSTAFEMTKCVHLRRMGQSNRNWNSTHGATVIAGREGEYLLGRNTTTGRLNYIIADANNAWAGGDFWKDTSFTLDLNTWAHVALTFDNGASRYMQMETGRNGQYRNGNGWRSH